MATTENKKPRPQRPAFKIVANSEEEEMAYDYVSHRTNVKYTSVTGSVAHIVKGALGGGILGGHVAYKKGGIFVALPLNIFFGMYMCYCLHLLSSDMTAPSSQITSLHLTMFCELAASYSTKLDVTHCSFFLLLVRSAQLLYRRTHIPSMSYPDVGEAACALHSNPKVAKCSKAFRHIIDFVICLDLFGACACYQLIIAKSIKQLVEGQMTSDNNGLPGYPHLRVYLAATLIPVILICMIRHLKWLAPFSIAANLVILVAMFSAVYYASQTNPSFSGMKSHCDFLEFLEFAGMIVFSMSAAGVVIPVENNMKEPHKFDRALIIGMGLIIIGTVMVSFFGYVGYLEECESPITVNFPMEIYPKVLKGMIAVMIFITHAVNFWPPFNICFYYLQRRHPEERLLCWELIYRALIVICIGVVAIIFPDINSFMGFLGAVCLSNMAFIWPSIIDILVNGERPGFGRFKWKLWRSLFCLFIGLFLLICGGIVNAKAMVQVFIKANIKP